jgi:glycosyltransferase involved in cell wall biosynthesis
MKIIYIAPSTIPSETANSVQVMKVCQALTRLGHDTQLVVPGTIFSDLTGLKQHYGLQTVFPIRWIPFGKGWRKIDFDLKAVMLARIEQADIIYTRLVWVAFLAGLRRIPTILEMHEVPSGSFGPLIYRLFLSQKSKKLTVFITRALKDRIESKLNLHHCPVATFVAPDGVDLERYKDLPDAAEARSQLHLPERFTAVYSGGFYPGRGLEILLDLAAAFPEVQFLCIGGKPEAVESWQNKIDDMNIQNVKLTGFIANSQLPLYQAAADILLMPYRRQVAGSSGGDIASVTSPMKLFEYMACGRAILSSDLPVLHEILNDKNAAFYPPEDLAALVQTFKKLKEDRNLRSSLGSRAKQDVVKYSWNERMKSILLFFNSL